MPGGGRGHLRRRVINHMAAVAGGTAATGDSRSTSIPPSTLALIFGRPASSPTIRTLVNVQDCELWVSPTCARNPFLPCSRRSPIIDLARAPRCRRLSDRCGEHMQPWSSTGNRDRVNRTSPPGTRAAHYFADVSIMAVSRSGERLLRLGSALVEDRHHRVQVPPCRRQFSRRWRSASCAAQPERGDWRSISAAGMGVIPSDRRGIPREPRHAARRRHLLPRRDVFGCQRLDAGPRLRLPVRHVDLRVRPGLLRRGATRARQGRGRGATTVRCAPRASRPQSSESGL